MSFPPKCYRARLSSLPKARFLQAPHLIPTKTQTSSPCAIPGTLPASFYSSQSPLSRTPFGEMFPTLLHARLALPVLAESNHFHLFQKRGSIIACPPNNLQKRLTMPCHAVFQYTPYTVYHTLRHHAPSMNQITKPKNPQSTPHHRLWRPPPHTQASATVTPASWTAPDAPPCASPRFASAAP